ncbi:MAG: methyltransferase [Pseudomonadota bacterium]
MRLKDRVLAWRDRTVAKPGFQRWAARFPLTRRIAQRRASALFNLATGFVYSQVLHACVCLDLFEILADGPLPLADLAPKLGLDKTAAERLLAAAIALQLIETRKNNRYGLGPHGAVLVGNQGILGMIRHHAMLYEDLVDPVALLRDEGRPTKLQAYWSYARNPDAAAVEAGTVVEYSSLMAASQVFIADEVLDAYDFRPHRLVMDLGGGEGAFLETALRRVPSLNAILFDLPAVAERARQRLDNDARVTFTGGDFLKGSLPDGADLISLVRVIHDHDDAVAMRILEAAGRALAPGGTLILAEPMAGTRGAEPMGDAYFGFYLMAMGSGRPRTVQALSEMLRQAGFTGIRQCRAAQPMLVRVLAARKS